MYTSLGTPPAPPDVGTMSPDNDIQMPEAAFHINAPDLRGDISTFTESSDVNSYRIGEQQVDIGAAVGSVLPANIAEEFSSKAQSLFGQIGIPSASVDADVSESNITATNFGNGIVTEPEAVQVDLETSLVIEPSASFPSSSAVDDILKKYNLEASDENQNVSFLENAQSNLESFGSSFTSIQKEVNISGLASTVTETTVETSTNGVIE